jgi:hypothetical protein
MSIVNRIIMMRIDTDCHQVYIHRHKDSNLSVNDDL